MKLPMVEVAKMLLIENKWSVIPVGANKIPLLPWKEFTERFATIEEIESWWKKWPTAMVGVVTGELSNLTVVDLEKGADISFLKDYLNTTQVKTGGGGIHVYYAYSDGIKNATRTRPLVDIRSEGGYVVSPYSVSEKGSYDYLQIKDELLPFPKELFPQKTYTPVGVPTNLTSNEISVKLLNTYTGFSPGQRNSEMAKFIGKVLCKISPVHWGTVGFSTVSKANEKNTPPLTPRELETTWKSIIGIRVRSTPIEAPYGPNINENGPIKEVDEDEEVEIEELPDDIRLMSNVAQGQLSQTDDIYPLQMQCFDELIWGGPCPGDLIVVSGDTGHGKTSVAQDWTISFLRGTRKAPVLWFSYEVTVHQLWKKFKEMGANEDELMVVPANNTTGNIDWIEKKVIEAKEKFGVKVVIIDHIGALVPKKIENAFKNMSSNYSTYLTLIMNDVKKVALKHEVIIVLPVPMKKTEKATMDAIRDSSGIASVADLVFLIERERNRDRDAKTYFTDLTKITLSKNRKTGGTLVAWFKMLNNRFAYDKKNNEEEEKEKEFQDFGKVESEKDNPYDEIK